MSKLLRHEARIVRQDEKPLKTDEECCCACWYEIAICACELDQAPCFLYIECAIADAFFEAHPELMGCLVFELDYPPPICYEMCQDPAYRVTVLPKDACLLTQIPPEETWYDDCNACCNECCPPCASGPGGTGTVCCHRPGDQATFTLRYEAFTVSAVCCNDGQPYNFHCGEYFYTATYTLSFCTGSEVMWIRNQGPTDDSCLPSLVLYACAGGGGWEMVGGPVCLNVDPCTLPQSAPPGCNIGGTPACVNCASTGGVCCLMVVQETFPFTGPCDGVMIDDDCYTDCSRMCRVIGSPYTSFSYVGCGPNQVIDPCPTDYHCGCNVVRFKFTTAATCTYDQQTGECLP